MSGKNYTVAKELSKEEQKMSQDCDVYLFLTLKIHSLRSDTGQSVTADAFRGKRNAQKDYDEMIKSLGDEYIRTPFSLKEFVGRGSDAVKREETLTINELNVVGKSTEYQKVLRLINKYHQLYRKVFLYVLVPTDHEASVASAFFLREIFDNSFLDRYERVESKKSEILMMYFAGSSLAGEKSGEKSSPEKPTDTDAKMAAIMSHYVYFYLDWLEYVHYHQGGVNRYKSNVKTEDILREFQHIEGKSGGVFKDGMFSAGEDKVKLRIVDRLNEIAKIVKDKEKDKHIAEILTLCKIQGRPLEFFDLYDKMGYWEPYLNDKEFMNEAMAWHVSHPAVVAENDKKGSAYNSFFFIKWKKNDIFFYEDSTTGGHIVYNSVLKHGMSGLSGYGGLLFVKTRIVNSVIEPVKFAYCTKGTDKNSLNDWILADVLQGLTGFSLQHVHTVKNAITLDKEIQEHYPGVPFFFCGHSLGGGLASSGAITSVARHAITFNAAGLNFLGSLSTRIVGSFANASLSPLRPVEVTRRVHPIRIKGEAIDELMKLAKLLTGGLNERAYGSDPLEIDFNDGFLAETAAKHGINNFLYKSLIRQVRIVDKSTVVRPVASGGVISISLNSISDGELVFFAQDKVQLFKFAQEATKQKKTLQ